jgi:hypothetical protein
MADPVPASNPSVPPHTHLESRRPATPQRVFLVAYPKIVFMYPTLIASLVAGIWMLFRQNEVPTTDSFIVSSVFLAVFTLNLLVFSFDFPRETSLVVAASIVALVLGLLLLFRTWEGILPEVTRILREYHPHANATFYFTIAAVMSIIYCFVGIGTRFDYWEVTPNELLHHHGIMADLKRYSSPNMRIDKEINDVFENLLLGSGRLILHPHNEARAIVLDNVMMINQKEARLTKMLGALKVQVAN